MLRSFSSTSNQSRKPPFWTDSDARLTDEFEIPDRFEAVESKLDLIGRTIQTAVNLVQSRRSHRVEWYIVILIVCEIALTLYEMFIRGR